LGTTTETAPTEAGADAALELRPAERGILIEECPAFAGTLRDPSARARYVELDGAVRDGAVPPHLVRSLETMLELLLQTQRVRLRHGPEAEPALTDLFYRTPRGAGLRQAARDVSRAFEALPGQTLENVSVLAGPGRHTLVFDTDRCRLTLKLDAGGARVDKVKIGR
jgi:hypothetical protein